MKRILLWVFEKSPIQIKLILGGILASLFALIVPPLFPHLKISPFIPFLILVITHSSLAKSLWIAFGIGLCMDLLSEGAFSVNTLALCVTVAYLFTKRRYFIKENPYNLSLFTTLFLICLTLLYIPLFFIFDGRVLLSGKWLVTDLLLYPLFDGLYAYFWFTLPFALWEKLEKKLKLRYGIE